MCWNSYLYQIEFVCGPSYHTRAQLECDMRPHKQRDLIQLAVPHMNVVPGVWFYFYHSLHKTAHKCQIKMKKPTHIFCQNSLIQLTFYLHFDVHFMSTKNVIQGVCITFIVNVIWRLYHILLGCIISYWAVSPL